MNLIVENLEFHYPGRPVLNDVSLTLEKGECLSILGTNGVGKSTLLKCINRILKQQSGKVIVMGETTDNLTGNELARRVGLSLGKSVFSSGRTFLSVRCSTRYCSGANRT